MNYKELTDEELLKAMEFCIKKEECGKDCSLFNVQGCMWNMFNQSFQLIRRLQNKIKLFEINLANEWEEHKQFVKLAKQIDEQQKAEIERLTEELDYYKGANRELTSTNEMLKGYRKQVDELEKENKFENKTWCNMIEDCPMAQQAVKDTAREILQYVGDLYDDCDQRFQLKDYQWHKELCKKYSVEVE